MKNQFIKGIIIGFISALLLTSCESDLLFADDDYNGGGIGSSEWNPMYVKIVD